ncbi:type II toxin-antitoxin system PemK/MazF family toxin [Candidatus Saccharibacteria bacterium]|nr:type II toxin-antitoxin system PemK/MazF family toxin [Candidatus Saccharibacteria bacterium]
MQKTYLNWIPIKVQRNNGTEHPEQYHESEIYWCYLGENIGSEQDGSAPLYTRPALIVKGFSKTLVWCIPISSKKEKSKYTMPVKNRYVDGILLLSQIRAIDTLRLGDYCGTINNSTLHSVKRAIARIIQI